MVSYLWRLEVRNQGVARAVFFLKPAKDKPSVSSGILGIVGNSWHSLTWSCSTSTCASGVLWLPPSWVCVSVLLLFLKDTSHTGLRAPSLPAWARELITSPMTLFSNEAAPWGLHSVPLYVSPRVRIPTYLSGGQNLNP